MDLMIQIGKWIAALMDYPLGWLLYLPRDLAVFIVAVGTGLVLAYARKWTTDQDLMRRCKEDLARLKQLKKQAGRDKDKDAKRRIQITVGMINLTRMKAEGWGLLASLIPIILLACWAFERLDYFPPARDREGAAEITFRATFPLADVGEPAWLTVDPDNAAKVAIPADDVVQYITVDDNVDPTTGLTLAEGEINGLAVWHFKVTEPSDSIKLTVAWPNGRMTHPLIVGGRQYAQPLILHSDDGLVATWVLHDQAFFLDRVPGMKTVWRIYMKAKYIPAPTPVAPDKGFFASIGPKIVYWAKFLVWLPTQLTWMAPWLTAYLIIAIIFVPLLRKALRIY